MINQILKKMMAPISDKKKIKNWHRNLYNKYLIKKDFVTLFAIDKDRIVGFIELQKRPSLPIHKVGCVGDICNLVVDKKYEGKGIAGLLKKESDKWFKKKKCKLVSISTYVENKRSLIIYKKWGFLPCNQVMIRELK